MPLSWKTDAAAVKSNSVEMGAWLTYAWQLGCDGSNWTGELGRVDSRTAYIRLLKHQLYRPSFLIALGLCCLLFLINSNLLRD